MDARELDETLSDPGQAPTFDEAAFIKHAERRSIRRTVRVSILVALATLVLLGLGWLGWRGAIDRQAQRIAEFYVPLDRKSVV